MAVKRPVVKKKKERKPPVNQIAPSALGKSDPPVLIRNDPPAR